MVKAHHVIYLPGLGDHRRWGQPATLKSWERFGVQAHYHQIGWADGEAFDSKLKRVVKEIDKLNDQGLEVSLVGTSAGASIALNAYSLRSEKVHKLVFICGKIRHPENVNPRYFKKNPALKESLYLSEANFQKLSDSDKHKMLYLHALSDHIVPPRFNKPAGIKSRAVLAFGHILGIFTAVTFYSLIIAKFIKS